MPVQSPLLQQSRLLGLPPLSDMLKFSGSLHVHQVNCQRFTHCPHQRRGVPEPFRLCVLRIGIPAEAVGTAHIQPWLLLHTPGRRGWLPHCTSGVAEQARCLHAWPTLLLTQASRVPGTFQLQQWLLHPWVGRPHRHTIHPWGTGSPADKGLAGRGRNPRPVSLAKHTG